MGAVIMCRLFREKYHGRAEERASKALAHFNLPHQEIDTRSRRPTFWKKTNYRTFSELSDLVSQEISTLHKEISVREDRIKELNQELGIRYKYDKR